MADRGRMPLLHLRISQALLDEVAALVPAVQRHPNFRGGTVTQQDVLRLVISRGIEVVRQEVGEGERS
jgi:hypothetical protein